MRENRRRYGSRRISQALAKNGTRIGRCKVRRLMREENLKAIRAKAFKPKTTDSKGTSAALNLLAEIKLEECAPQKIIIGDITYIRLRGGKFCYLASLAGQGNPSNNRLEFIAGDDRRFGHFRLKSDQKGLGQSRSDYSFGSWQSIYVKRISGIAQKKRFSPINVGQRSLLR
jgi:hypothetical protein